MLIIKELRKSKGATQTDLAEAIGVSLRTVQTYEQEDSNIPTNNLKQIARFFDLEIADLYLRKMDDDQATYANRKPFNHFGSRCYPLDYGKYYMVTPLVLAELHQRYIQHIVNREKQANEMKTGFLVEGLEERNYRAFEISGDSMNNGSINAIPNKAIVLGTRFTTEEISKQSESCLNQTVVLVLKDRITCKLLSQIDIENGSVRCSNLNGSPEFQDFDLLLTDIVEVFKVVKKQL